MAAEAASPASSLPAERLAGWRLAVGALAISVGFFLAMLDLTIVNVAVPHIAGSIGVSPSQGTWIVTSYAVAEAVCVLLTGWLAKRFGTLRTFLYGLGAFVLASALCGMASSLSTLVLFRTLQGMSGAPLLPLAQVLLLRIFPENKAGMAMALSAMIAVIAPIIGPVLSGAITDNLSWRWLFYLNIPIALICIPVVARVLAPFETARIVQRIDVVGLAMLVVWVGAFQLMLDLGRERDWFGSPLITALAIVAFIGFIAFVMWELTEEAPIVDLHVLRHRGFWTSILCMSVGYASLMTSFVMIPLWLQTTMGYTATYAGFMLAPNSIFSLAALPLAGRLVAKIDPRIMIYGGLTWQAGVAILRGLATPDLAPWQIALPQLFQGMATGFFMLGLTVVALKSVKPAEMASASGMMGFSRLLATAVFISWATTHWENGTQIARAQLAGVMNGAGTTIAALVDQGLSAIQARALVEQLVESQSRTIAYDDVFLTIGIVGLVIAQLTWLIPRPRTPDARPSAG